MNKLDEYKTLQIPLAGIIKKEHEALIPIIEDVVLRVSRITRKTYFSLKLYLLAIFDDIMEDNDPLEFPLINKDLIHAIQKSILIPTLKGRQAEEDKTETIDMFRKINKFSLEDGTNLSQTLVYENTTIITNIENNIKEHFEDYINKFVNNIFGASRKNKNQWLELSKVKKDIFNDTLESDEKYHNWINKYRYFMVPRDYEKSHQYNLTVNPQQYLAHMFWMNNTLEGLGRPVKMMSVLPIGSGLVPKYTVIDTKSLIELYYTDKAQYLNDIEGTKDILWSTCSNIPYYNENYSFDYSIETDGITVSLRYIYKIKLIEVNTKKHNMAAGRRRTPEEKAEVNRQKELRKKEELIKKQAEKNIRELEQETLKELKKTNPTLYKTKMTEKKELKKQLAIQATIKKNASKEFKYIDDEEVYKALKDLTNIVYVDPGKKNLIKLKGYDLNGKEVFITYSNQQHLHNTRRLEYAKKLFNHKQTTGILRIERVLDKYNSKSCSYYNFLRYALKYYEIHNQLEILYSDKKFRKYKWYASIAKKRTYDQLNNLIAKTFGSNAILIIGDGSINPSMRNFISTPNKTIKRKLKEKFETYLIDEFRTSCINCVTEKLNKNMYIPDKNGVTRKLHSVLTYQMENKRIGCINRDKNACNNIEKLYKHYMLYKAGLQIDSRPLVFQRSYKLKEEDRSNDCQTSLSP